MARKDKAIELYKAGYDIGHIAKLLGVSNWSVLQYTRELRLSGDKT
jgi:predicted transcriptional regulator